MLSAENYNTTGIAMAMTAVIVFALGATIGLLWHNTIAVLAVTLVCAVALPVATGVLRADFVPPSRYHEELSEESRFGDMTLPTGTWYIDLTYESADGTDMTRPFNHECSGDVACGEEMGVATVTSLYHRPDRFWPMQSVEAAIYLAITGMVLLLGYRVLRRRLN